MCSLVAFWGVCGSRGVTWPQPPPPPPLQPAYPQGQQPEGSQQTHQQRDFREESEARTVNSTVPESNHIY
jgi:hypothetical protein